MIQINTGMSGHFKLEKFRGAEVDGKVIEEPNSRVVVADWQDNIITDQGLNDIGTRNIQEAVEYAHVGSGSSTPTATDTSLDSWVASTSTVQSQSTDTQSSTAPYYISLTRTNRFGQGAAAGNLSEVGMGWGSANGTLFSRALILDSGGSPTTITVLSDEYLDVTYQLRVYPDTTDQTGTIDIGGVTYDYTARPSDINVSNVFGWDLLNKRGTSSTSSTPSRAYDGNISTVFDSPNGISDNGSSAQAATYSNNSLQAAITNTYGLNDANFAGGIRSVAQRTGWAVWQVEFSNQSDGTTIPKDDTKEFSITITHSWARRP